MPAKAPRRKSSCAPRTEARGEARPKVKVFPTVRPAPPPPRATPDPKPDVRCSSGDDCPAVAEIGRPEKIRATKGEKGYCDRCLTRRADATTRDLEARRAGGAPRLATA